MLRQKESEILFIDFSDYQNIDKIIGRFSRHIFNSSSYYEKTEVVFSFKKVIEFTNSIKSFTKYHLKIRKNRTLKIERIVLRVIFSTRFQNSEIFEVLKFSSYSIDLFIDIPTKFTNKEVFLWIKSMLQEKFFQEFFTTIWSEEFFERYHGQFLEYNMPIVWVFLVVQTCFKKIVVLIK